MSDIHEQLDIEIIEQSGRFKILSEDGKYRDFVGIAKGHPSDYLYEYKDNLYTANHVFIIDGEEVKAKDIGVKTDSKDDVYEILHVDETHNYYNIDTDGNADLLNNQCLILDEFAFVDHTAEFMKAAFPVISSAQDKKNSKIIILSTPNGMNDFYQIWRKAKAGVNDFQWFKIDWRDVPRNVSPDEFRSQEIAKSDAITFEQEYGCVDPSTIVTVKDALGNIKDITVGELGELLK